MATNRNTELCYDHVDHLTVTKYDIAVDRSRELGKIEKRTLRRATTAVTSNALLSGDEVNLPFFARVEGPGLYHLRFYTEPVEMERNVIAAVGNLSANASVVCSANEYIVAKPWTDDPQNL